MNKKIIYLCILSIVSVFMFACIITYAQTGSGGIEREINHAKSAIKGSGVYAGLQIYRAIRDDNLFACQSESCKSNAAALLNFRYMAEGKCAEVKGPLYQELCGAINSGACDSVGVSWKRDYCLGMVRKDPTLLEKAITKAGAEFSKLVGVPVNRPEAVIGLGVYHGFKKYNILACEECLRSEKMPLSKKVACKVIFSNDPDRTIEDLIEDLAIFTVSRMEEDYNLCERIRDSNIRDNCKNKNIKSIQEIW